jgi:hypothetical protein
VSEQPDTPTIDYVRPTDNPGEQPGEKALWHIAAHSPLGLLISYACKPNWFHGCEKIMTTRTRPARVCGKCREAKGV